MFLFLREVRPTLNSGAFRPLFSNVSTAGTILTKPNKGLFGSLMVSESEAAINQRLLNSVLSNPVMCLFFPWRKFIITVPAKTRKRSLRQCQIKHNQQMVNGSAFLFQK
jgi:hypothetical protein